MRRALVLLLLLSAVSAWAQDGGTPPPGVPAVPPPAPAAAPPAPAAGATDAGVAELSFPGFLRGGSEAAAGLDVATAGEIVHPSNPAALVASLRSVGAVLEGGQQSFVLQFNPYLLSKGYQQLYPEARDARKLRLNRYLQDSAITLAVSEDSPYKGVTFEEGRFATVMAGASVDVFGDRSVYGDAYNTCLQRVLTDQSLYDFPEPPLSGEFANTAQYEQALAEHPAAMQRARQAGIERIRQGLSACTRQVREASSALFFSAGGRWVTPGLKGQETDGIVIQRGFGAATLELLSGGSTNLEAAVQLRALYERQRPEEHMGKWFDVGLSMAVASPRILLKLEATQSFAKLEGTAQQRASVVVTSRIMLADNWTIGIGVQGDGKDLVEAIGQVRPSLVVNFADVPNLAYPVPKPSR